ARGLAAAGARGRAALPAHARLRLAAHGRAGPRQPQGPAGVPAPAQVPPQHPLGQRVRPGKHAMTAAAEGAKPAVAIYTDGACSGNPGPGGWGAILVSGKHRKEIRGGEALTTNNRMELTAAI